MYEIIGSLAGIIGIFNEVFPSKLINDQTSGYI